MTKWAPGSRRRPRWHAGSRRSGSRPSTRSTSQPGPAREQVEKRQLDGAGGARIGVDLVVVGDPRCELRDESTFVASAGAADSRN